MSVEEPTFEVNTEVPKLTISGPAARSNNTTPSFSGTTTEDGEVVVHIMESGKPVATAATHSSSGSWNVTSSALPGGNRTYSAY
ncbi:Ig-like domain-containing protein, partial [Rhizobium phaseoli]|uniref:Ig-like domain-containing protein n=1 Tax=Rhizobium phaseoli TaxID=396 RepID=UPI00143694CC